MKRLTILAVVAILAVSAVGCNRSWPRLWCYRGDPCDDCPTYDAPGVYGEYGGSMVLPGVTEIPGPATTLPGPAVTQPAD